METFLFLVIPFFSFICEGDGVVVPPLDQVVEVTGAYSQTGGTLLINVASDSHGKLHSYKVNSLEGEIHFELVGGFIPTGNEQVYF